MSEFNKLHEYLRECVDSENDIFILTAEEGVEFNIYEWAFALSIDAKREHDRLTKENKLLRETLNTTSLSIGRLLDADQCDGEMKEFINARNQAFCSAKQINELISELDCQSQASGTNQEFNPLDFVKIGEER